VTECDVQSIIFPLPLLQTELNISFVYMFVQYYIVGCGAGIAVSTVTACGLDGLHPVLGKRVISSVQHLYQPWGLTSLLSSGYQMFCPWGRRRVPKQLGCEGDLLTFTYCQGQEWYNCTSYIFIVWCLLIEYMRWIICHCCIGLL
jgi:hypothetical protein